MVMPWLVEEVVVVEPLVAEQGLVSYKLDLVMVQLQLRPVFASTCHEK